jgi:hypothetical protein
MSLVRQLMQSREDWLEHLQSEFKIKVTRDGDLASLKYDMIESPMHEPIVQECRGMVVDVSRKQVLAWPYNKFWNHGEALAAPIDWSTARVQEKLDGSLMILYWNPSVSAWVVASSGTPRASGSFGNLDAESSRTFSRAFWQAFEALDMSLPSQDHQRMCFMFEFCALENRIVVRHDKPRIVLHGVRDVNAGVEWSHGDLCSLGTDYGWEVVKTYPIGTIEDALFMANALDPLVNEGFVVVDGKFNRVKIKSPRYVVLHHMKGEATPRRAIELWQAGETQELLAHFPEMAAAILPVQERLEDAALRAWLDFDFNRHLPTQKDFALAVKDTPWSAVTFLLKKHPDPSIATARTILRGLTLAALERIAS